MNWSKAIHGIYTALFLAVAAWAGLFFLQMHRELTALRAQEENNRRRLAAAEAKLREQREYLDRLQHDPALVERLIRRKLGYAKPEEFVFRFEDDRN
jgi:cell division protein DivIC